ncbi:MAG: Matrixin [Acidimicrobiaceae bacterium]|jgi:hypothetical protein|nr:Matrixin [Acidimicrobiaceae bacterium]
MVHRLRLALAVIWAATLVLVAAVAVLLSGGIGGVGGTGAAAAAAASRTAGVRPVVAQPAVEAASASRAADAVLSPAADDTTSTTPTTAAPTTVAPTTTPPTTASTAPPATAHVATTAPRTVATTAPRPATTPAPAPAPAPAKSTPAGSSGSANDFSLIGYRWNPCQVITVNSTGPAVAGIVSELASITGLRIQVVSGPAAITVIWGPVPADAGIGLTTWRAVGSWLTSAAVVISQQAQPYLATVLRHELGHSLGLGHASRSNEVMYASAGSGSPTDYQAGDLAGLRAIGTAAGGC